jgi:hypothetical protein
MTTTSTRPASGHPSGSGLAQSKAGAARRVGGAHAPGAAGGAERIQILNYFIFASWNMKKSNKNA